MSLSNVDKVSNMYVKKDTLSTRIAFQNKYSVNKYGFGNWIFDQYNLESGFKVLELGCGTGNVWNGRDKRIPEDIEIILTDFSALMLEKIQDLLKNNSTFSFKQVDIQDIPFDDETFDIVIANHMLYHVPDIEKAICEVNRVLKPNGMFYASTTGENTMHELQLIYKEFSLSHNVNFSYANKISFTLENGKPLLEKYFKNIDIKQYIDSFKITSVDDLMEYIKSYNDVPENCNEEFYLLLKSKFSEDGIFNVRKEQGLFICSK